MLLQTEELDITCLYYFMLIPKPNKAPKAQITTQYIIKKKAY